MALYPVTLYFNTGFDSTNIPDSPALLGLSIKKTYNPLWLLQDLDLLQVKIEANWDDIEGADYCQINNKYYYITNIAQENINVARLTLELDALTTIGLANISVNSGWCTRRHVTDDTPFINTIEEPFTPSEIGVTDFQEIPVNTEVSWIIMGSTVSLDEIPELAKTFEDAKTNKSVTIPLVTPIQEGTTVEMYTNISTVLKQQLPNLSLYNLKREGFEDKYNEIIQILRSLGIESAITCCYVLYPIAQLEATYNSGDDSSIKTLTSRIQAHQMANLPYKWQDVSNNKVYAGQFNRYTVYSVCSGDKQEFIASQIKGIDETFAPSFVVWLDASPLGRSYCRPEFYEGNDGTSGLDSFIACIQGSEWLNTPVLLSGASGSRIAAANTQFQNMQSQNNLIVNTLKTVGSVAAVVGMIAAAPPAGIAAAAGLATGSAVTGALGSVVSNINQANQINKNNFDLQVSNNLQAPVVKFPVTDSLQAFVGNGFYVTRSRLSHADTVRFDRYLTMFGYAVSEPLNTLSWIGRRYFNYIKANDVVLNVPLGTPLRVKVMAENQFMRGVRIWHVKPDNYTVNPIVESEVIPKEVIE